MGLPVCPHLGWRWGEWRPLSLSSTRSLGGWSPTRTCSGGRRLRPSPRDPPPSTWAATGELFRVSGSDRRVCSDSASRSGSAGKTSRTKQRKQLLTHHHQRQLLRVHARRLLHFALVGGRVRHPRVRNGDGGVAHFGVTGELEPGGDGGVAIAVRLAAGVRQNLKGGERWRSALRCFLRAVCSPSPPFRR